MGGRGLEEQEMKQDKIQVVPVRLGEITRSLALLEKLDQIGGIRVLC